MSDEPIEFLMPGVWVDSHRRLHFRISDLLDNWGWGHTKSNEQRALKIIHKVIAKRCPNALVITKEERR